MSDFDLNRWLTRRNALATCTRIAAGVAAAVTLGKHSALADAEASDGGSTPSEDVKHRIEEIIGAHGKTSNGVFSISLDRKDLKNVQLHGTPIKPAFQLNGDIYFQTEPDGRSLMNADFPLKPEELDPFIDQLIEHDIVFQAEHQHLYDLQPMVWFIHFRAAGDAEKIARGIKAALQVTSTPFPQKPRQNPTTPLPAKEIGQIIGAKPSVKEDGVVTLNVPRAETIRLGGIVANPYLNIAAPIAFQPLGNGNAAAVPDFAMLASEVNKVVRVMRKQGWEIGCLYNQETDEHPQLYFSHQFKTGNALQLAREIRNGLNQTNSKFK
jgi:hypothetical protein